MTEELYNKIDKFCNETDWSKYLTYEHALEEFIKEIVEEETKELEKENAELKAKNKWYSEQVCNKECAEVWGNLTKAKEKISKLLEVIKRPYQFTALRKIQLVNEAVQFLSEVEKC